MNISIYKDGQQYGPFSPEEALEHVLKGVFNPNTDYAWHEGLSDWLPLKAVILHAAPPPPLLQAPSPPPPPAPAKQSLSPKMIGLLVVCIGLVGVVGVVLNQGPYSDPSQPQLAALCMFFCSSRLNRLARSRDR